ncbi:hypothetical protein AVEN_219197-1 [Araneus ventricosus]|uniref:Uncharacterized protein n=1 Tax=Araneus ventricosus TaxID=182803 RepID=A0A4Y2HWH0_ARAVE|nr:hypothetical protein AVEN_219197-1 [Araneus ventricosus]
MDLCFVIKFPTSALQSEGRLDYSPYVYSLLNWSQICTIVHSQVCFVHLNREEKPYDKSHHVYGDGGVLQSLTGGSLPEPRDPSLKIFKDRHRPTVDVSFQFAIFAEFLAIDIFLCVRPPIDCCSKKNMNNPECKPISIRTNDPFYSKFNKTCVNFQRTEQCACNTQQKAPKNGVTSAIDVSQLYGTNENKIKGTKSAGWGRTVDDIDMWVGIQLEDHMSGAITGPSASTPNNSI